MEYYKKVQPTANNLDGFTSNDTIDFEILNNQQELINNSLFLDFEVEIKITGDITNTDDIFLNPHIGANCFFDSWQVSTASGMLQNIQNYQRLTNIITQGTQCNNDMFSSSNHSSGKGIFKQNGKIALQRNTPQVDSTTPKLFNPQFTVKPLICFNQVQSGSGNYQFDKNGNIVISCTLANIENAFFGSTNTATKYTIKNIQLRYKTRASQNTQPLLMTSYINIKQTLISESNVIQSIIPSTMVSGIVMSFIKQSDIGSSSEDTHRLSVLKDIKALRWMFNGSLQDRITYEIIDIKSMMDQGLAVLRSENNNMTYQQLKDNDSFIVGLDFQQMLDLSKTLQEVNIDLFSSPTDTLTAFLYFKEFIKL